MMKTKKVGKYIYEGLGFPIELKKVKMIKLYNEWHPEIDVRKIADEAIKSLSLQKERLTGNQVKFIRNYFSMSLRDFADNVVNESHSAVSKWEKCGNEVTNMDINIEKILRLYIHEKIDLTTTKQKNKFYEYYQRLKQIQASDKRVSHLQISYPA